jgi:hypothetical protein
VLGLARPHELRIEMGIVCVFFTPGVLVGFKRYRANWRIVEALFIVVRICFDISLEFFFVRAIVLVEC